MSNYSPNWSPGTPLEDDETISQAEKEEIASEMKRAGASASDLREFWSDDQEEDEDDA